VTTATLTPDQFAARAVGIPWARWQAEWTGLDCFGLLILWHRHVLGLDITLTPDPSGSHDSTTAGWLDCGAGAGWQRCEPEPGAVAFMGWIDGAPTHCGIVLAGDRLLHCQGKVDQPGSVRITRGRAIRAIFDDVRHYRREPQC
jgi:hypothetical protein